MKAERSMLYHAELEGERLLLCPIHIAAYINEVAQDRSVVKAEISPLEDVERAENGIGIRTSNCQVLGCKREIGWALWLHRPFVSYLPS